ncbi:hypothetical protein CMO91_01755 [Candidatus Woesearchaeota archaeon]|nr:hypothetical protein [Candidatus Woesearchaeota archaeon]
MLKQQGYDQTDIEQASVKESAPLLFVVGWGLSAAYFFITLAFILISLLADALLAWVALLVGAFVIGTIAGFGLVRATTRPWKVATMASLAPFLAMILLPIMTLLELTLEKVGMMLEPFTQYGGKAAAAVGVVDIFANSLPSRFTAAFLIFISAVFIPTMFLIKRKKFKALACLLIGVVVCFVAYQISHTLMLLLFENVAGRF